MATESVSRTSPATASMPPLMVAVQKIVDALTAAMEGHGLAPGELILDGKIHRCGTTDKPHSLNGWYVAHGDEPASTAYGDWRTGETWTFCAKGDRELTPEERERLKARMEADRKRRQEEEAKRHAEARTEAKRILAAIMPAPADHGYLVRKQVKRLGDLRIADDGRLVVPVLDAKGAVMSLQFIAQDGGKRFLPGGKLKGGYFPIPAANGEKNGPLYVCEGYATGATIHVATDAAVLVAFNCGNLPAVAEMARAQYPNRKIVLCADDDHETAAREGKNPGIEKATEAALAVKAPLAVPRFTDPAGKSDFNDLAQAEGIEAVQAILDAILAESPTPVLEVPLDHGGAILIREGALAEAVDAAEAVLARPDLPIADRVFQRAGRLVRVGVLPVPGPIDGVTRPQGAVVILPVEKPFLLTVLPARPTTSFMPASWLSTKPNPRTALCRPRSPRPPPRLRPTRADASAPSATRTCVMPSPAAVR